MKAKYFFGAVGQGSRVKLIVNMIMGELLIFKRIFPRIIMSHRIVPYYQIIKMHVAYISSFGLCSKLLSCCIPFFSQ